MANLPYLNGHFYLFSKNRGLFIICALVLGIELVQERQLVWEDEECRSECIRYGEFGWPKLEKKEEKVITY